LLIADDAALPFAAALGVIDNAEEDRAGTASDCVGAAGLPPVAPLAGEGGANLLLLGVDWPKEEDVDGDGEGIVGLCPFAPPGLASDDVWRRRLGGSF